MSLFFVTKQTRQKLCTATSFRTWFNLFSTTRAGKSNSQICEHLLTVPIRTEKDERLTPVLPPKDPFAKELTLVLDLDETLVHSEIGYNPFGDYSYTSESNGSSFAV